MVDIICDPQELFFYIIFSKSFSAIHRLVRLLIMMIMTGNGDLV